jgi:hypothetical protein
MDCARTVLANPGATPLPWARATCGPSSSVPSVRTHSPVCQIQGIFHCTAHPGPYRAPVAPRSALPAITRTMADASEQQIGQHHGINEPRAADSKPHGPCGLHGLVRPTVVFARGTEFKIFGSRDAATIRAGTVSLLANPQFSIQRSVVGAQFCLRRKSVLRFRPPSILAADFAASGS